MNCFLSYHIYLHRMGLGNFYSDLGFHCPFSSGLSLIVVIPSGEKELRYTSFRSSQVPHSLEISTPKAALSSCDVNLKPTSLDAIGSGRKPFATDRDFILRVGLISQRRGIL